MTRALVYLAVMLLDVHLRILATFAPGTCITISVLLEPVRRWARPRPAPRAPRLDMRLAYPVRSL